MGKEWPEVVRHEGSIHMDEVRDPLADHHSADQRNEDGRGQDAVQARGPQPHRNHRDDSEYCTTKGQADHNLLQAGSVASYVPEPRMRPHHDHLLPSLAAVMPVRGSDPRKPRHQWRQRWYSTK